MPLHDICSTGLRYLLLFVLGRDSEWLASWLAITAAVLHFLHSAGLEQTLDKFGLISRRRLQRLSEVAHFGCGLKLHIELSADVPFIISSVRSGEQSSTDCSMSLSIHACPSGCSVCGTK